MPNVQRVRAATPCPHILTGPYAACMALDGGAAGVIAPYVETAEEVRSLSGESKLRPIKGRKLRALLDGAPAAPELAAYLAAGAEQRLLIVNTESAPAIEALDEILDVEGLDAVLIGPQDLSCNLGLPEQYEHPDFLAACETILQEARRAHRGAGIHFWGDAGQQAKFLRMGANMLIHSADVTLFQKHLRAELDLIQKAARAVPRNG